MKHVQNHRNHISLLSTTLRRHRRQRSFSINFLSLRLSHHFFKKPSRPRDAAAGYTFDAPYINDFLPLLFTDPYNRTLTLAVDAFPLPLLSFDMEDLSNDRSSHLSEIYLVCRGRNAPSIRGFESSTRRPPQRRLRECPTNCGDTVLR